MIVTCPTSWPTPRPLQIGDRVAFTGAYLRAVQGHEMAHWRGTVIEAGGVLLRVDWDGQHRAGTPVLARNLVRVDRMHLDPV